MLCKYKQKINEQKNNYINKKYIKIRPGTYASGRIA